MGGVVEALGWGLVAGLVGTMAQTVSQLIEQRFTHREDSTVTVQVGAMLLRPPLKTGEQASRLGGSALGSRSSWARCGACSG